MTKVVFVRIQLGNDTMQTSDQVAEALRSIANRLETKCYLDYGDDNRPFEKGIQDSNGNHVGEFGLREE